MAKGILGSPNLQGNSEEIVSASYAGQAIDLNGGVAVSLIGRNEVGNRIVGPFDGVNFFGFVAANDVNTRAETVSVTRKGLDVPVMSIDGADFSQGVGLNADGVICAISDAVYSLNAQVSREQATAIGRDKQQIETVSINIFGGVLALNGNISPPPVKPTLTISDIGGDNSIGSDEASSVVISGTTSAEDSQTVSISILDSTPSEIGTASGSITSGTWTSEAIDMSGYAAGDYTVKANVTNAAGISADEATKGFSVEAAAPASPTITISTIATDDSISVAESSSVTIPGQTTNVEDSQTVSIVITDSTPTDVYTGSADVFGSAWTSEAIDMSGYAAGDYTVKANVSNLGGTAAPEATKTITIEGALRTSARRTRPRLNK